MQRRLSRRRVLAIAAVAAGLPLPGAAEQALDAPLVTWMGQVLGAVGSISLRHPDRAAAERIVARAVAELHRLEAMFSLYRPDSLLVELNRRGVLAAPPPEMRQILDVTLHFASLTGGVFDPTVQPLWDLYRAHFTRSGADPAGPPPAAVAEALDRVGHRHLRVGPDAILFAQRGMAVTLNGIAQGYITDRVIDLLRAEGIAHTLVDMGEARALGGHSAARPWRIALEDPDAPDRPWKTLDLVDRALASSGDDGFVFDAAGRFTHLLDPRTAGSPRLYRAVSVLAPEATTADALSTAFALMPEGAIATALRGLPMIEAHLLRHDGSTAALRGG
jgi:thiamine biosynthesis lipoprotein